MSEFVSWHVEADFGARYARGDLAPADAASVEMHVMACADCRARLAGSTDRERLAAGWVAIEDRVDQPRVGPFERLLVRVGLRDHLARLVAVTPSLRAPWVAAVAALLFLSVVATRDAPVHDRGFFFFLVLAPLLPLAGVGAAFGPRADPAHELTVAAPIPAIELLLVRVAAVLAMTTALSGVAALALPENDWTTVAWLLPALGLTTAALALSRWIPAVWAAVGLGSIWVTGAFVTALDFGVRADLAAHFVPFRPAGQFGFTAVTLAAVVVIVHQRNTFDLRRTA